MCAVSCLFSVKKKYVYIEWLLLCTYFSSYQKLFFDENRLGIKPETCDEEGNIFFSKNSRGIARIHKQMRVAEHFIIKIVFSNSILYVSIIF